MHLFFNEASYAKQTGEVLWWKK